MTPIPLNDQEKQDVRKKLEAARDKALFLLNEQVKVERENVWQQYWAALDALGLDKHGRPKPPS